MPEVAAPWLAGAQDSDRSAAKAAQDALRQTFNTPEKLQSVPRVFQQSILEYCRNAIVDETVQTLSDERTVSADDAEATYARVIATSLAVVNNLLSELSPEEIEKQRASYDTLLGDEKVWAFASDKDVGVRRAVFRLMRTCLEQEKGKLTLYWVGYLLNSIRYRTSRFEEC